MADDVQDIYIATEAGDAGWQSLTELTASKVDAKLPIESVDGTVVLSDSSGSFEVSTGNPSATRLTVSNDAVNSSVAIQTPSVSGLADNDASVTLGASAKIQTEANNSFQINPAGQSYGVLHTARNNSKSAHVTRPFLESINANANYNVRQTAWEYTTIDLLSGDPSNPYLLNDYYSQAFPGKVDSYKGFSVGGFDPRSMEATEAVGCYLNVGLPDDGRQWYSIWCDGAAPSRFDGDILCSRISGLADNDASVTLGASLVATAGTGGQFIAQTNKVGRFFIDSSGYATFKPLGVERVAINAEGLQIKQLAGADDTYGKDVARLQLRNTSDTDNNLVLITYGENIEDPAATFAAGGGNSTAIVGRSEKPFSIGTETNQPLQLASNNLVQVSITQDDVTFSSNIKAPSVSGLANDSASVTLGGQATLTKGDGSEYVPGNAASIATKKYADDKIVVCTSAEYAAISPKLSGTLYCLTD